MLLLCLRSKRYTVTIQFFLPIFFLIEILQFLLFGLFILAYRKCHGDDFHCDEGLRTQSQPCIAKEKRCDGYFDCRNEKDEQNCPGVSCRLDQFRCANGQRCIELNQKCDHRNDCGDNSDEMGCSKYKKKYLKNHSS